MKTEKDMITAVIALTLCVLMLLGASIINHTAIGTVKAKVEALEVKNKVYESVFHSLDLPKKEFVFGKGDNDIKTTVKGICVSGIINSPNALYEYLNPQLYVITKDFELIEIEKGSYLLKPDDKPKEK